MREMALPDGVVILLAMKVVTSARLESLLLLGLCWSGDLAELVRWVKVGLEEERAGRGSCPSAVSHLAGP